MTHTCRVCGATEATAEFYSGVTARCKECHKRAVRENRAANVEKYRQYDAARFREDPRVKARHRRYQSTEEGKAAMQRARQKWAGKDPRRRAAHVILNNAVRRGKLDKPKACTQCGATGRIEGHHPDYDFPLHVVWLCAPCHHKAHKGD